MIGNIPQNLFERYKKCSYDFVDALKMVLDNPELFDIFSKYYQLDPDKREIVDQIISCPEIFFLHQCNKLLFTSSKQDVDYLKKLFQEFEESFR